MQETPELARYPVQSLGRQDRPGDEQIEQFQVIQAALALLPGPQRRENLHDEGTGVDFFQHRKRERLTPLVMPHFLQYARCHRKVSFWFQEDGFSFLYQIVTFLSTPSSYSNGIGPAWYCRKP